MKKIFIIVLSVLLPLVAWAQHGDLKISVEFNGDSILQDRYGNRATVKIMSVFGERIIDKRDGEQVSIKKDALGSITIKSNRGVSVVLKETMMGERSVKDSYGGNAIVLIDSRGGVKITDSKDKELLIAPGFYGNIREIEKYAFFDDPYCPDCDEEDHGRVEEQIYREIRRSRNGDLEYTYRRDRATLKRDSFDRIIYEDSNGNELRLSNDTWRKMVRRERDEKRVFASLVSMYLL